MLVVELRVVDLQEAIVVLALHINEVFRPPGLGSWNVIVFQPMFSALMNILIYAVYSLCLCM